MVAVISWRLLDGCFHFLEAFSSLLLILGGFCLVTVNSLRLAVIFHRLLEGCCHLPESFAGHCYFLEAS